MILYHGSNIKVDAPNLAFSRSKTDFGKGFYLTPLREQADSWARRFEKESGTAVVSTFEFLSRADHRLSEDIRVLEFDTHNLQWLDFVSKCRLGIPMDKDWDLIIGGVANDKVFDTIQLYFDGLIDADAAIGRLRYNKPNHQYCFKSQQLIDEHLKFVASEVLP